MTPLHKVLVGAGVAALLIAGGVAYLKPSSEPMPNATPTVSAAVAPAPASGPAQDELASEAPAWETSQNVPPSRPLQRSAVANPMLPRGPAPLSIAQMDQQIALREEQAAALLKQLDLAQAKGDLPPDLNPDAVRTNLKVALKAQKLGRELIHLTQQPSTPERQQRMTQITAEMTALQRELRNDVMVATAGTSR